MVEQKFGLRALRLWREEDRRSFESSRRQASIDEVWVTLSRQENDFRFAARSFQFLGSFDTV